MKVRFVPLDKKSWEWIHERAKPEWTNRTKGVVAIGPDGAILAVAVFDTWTFSSGQVHVAIENRLAIRHGFIEECLHYFFNTCDRKVLICTIPTINEKSLRFTKNLGFRDIFVIKDGYDVGVDYVIREMRKDDCRWIDGKANSRRTRLQGSR